MTVLQIPITVSDQALAVIAETLGIPLAQITCIAADTPPDGGWSYNREEPEATPSHLRCGIDYETFPLPTRSARRP